MKTLTTILSIIIAIMLSSMATANNTPMQDYRIQASALYQQLNKQNPAQLTEKSKALVELSKSIVKANIRSLPQCKVYLTALLNAADNIAQLPINEIESGYHSDGKLPPLTDGACYHAKDLLVHPATVQAMAIQGIDSNAQWKQAAHETEEVLEHLSIVETVLAKQ